MKMSLIVITSCAALGLLGSAANAATGTSEDGMVKHPAHRHHLARYRAPSKTMSDTPQEQTLPATTPDPEPEYFNHAKGVDGSN